MVFLRLLSQEEGRNTNLPYDYGTPVLQGVIKKKKKKESVWAGSSNPIRVFWEFRAKFSLSGGGRKEGEEEARLVSIHLLIFGVTSMSVTKRGKSTDCF